MKTTPTIQPLTDQEQIRHLIDAYAHHADRRNAAEQAALFTERGRVLVYTGDPGNNEPVQTVTGRDELEAAFAGLSAYQATTHFTGQSTIDITGETATGETYCLAYHLHDVEGVRTLTTMSIRYVETIARVAAEWRFAERKLIIDWTDSRPSTDAP